MEPIKNRVAKLSFNARMERLGKLIDEYGGAPEELRKRFIKSFLSALQSKARYLYILLDNLSIETFTIVRYFNKREAANK